MNTIRINGMTITAGRNINITGDRVFIDGKDVTPDAKNISIEVTGNVDRIEADACGSITVSGDAGPISTQSGNVSVGGSVNGSIQTMSGDVECGDVSSNISTMSGDIRCSRA